jgi:hypothetical protein
LLKIIIVEVLTPGTDFATKYIGLVFWGPGGAGKRLVVVKVAPVGFWSLVEVPRGSEGREERGGRREVGGGRREEGGGGRREEGGGGRREEGYIPAV